MKPHQLIDTCQRDGRVSAEIAHRAADMAAREAASTQLPTRDTDRKVAVLAPDAVLVLDSSLCIVLVTPARRITVTDVASWREHLTVAKTFQQIYADDAGQETGQAASRG